MTEWCPGFNAVERFGILEEQVGLRLAANGPPQTFVGEACDILNTDGNALMTAIVTGFTPGRVYLMPFESGRVRPGLRVRARHAGLQVPVGSALRGRVIDALGQPLDGLGTIACKEYRPLHHSPINPLSRAPINEQLLTGVGAIDTLIALGRGQRMGLFAGSGVGKSTLLGHIARDSRADINVVALIGERGREVQEFMTQTLDAATRAKTVLVVACSDTPAVARREAAFSATAIAEYFCDAGLSVMLFIDSVTRLALAQREIALSQGEPPTARGFTPSVFALLPELLERAGNFADKGSITALYTVLVEGDDFNEPLSDTLRALLDGHIVLSRERAHRGQFPAIDILQSVSRLNDHILPEARLHVIRGIRRLLSVHDAHRDLVSLGAYASGKNAELDNALSHLPEIETLLYPDSALPLEHLLERFGAMTQ